MPDNWMEVTVCEGVVIAFDPAKFETVGMPMGFMLDSRNFKLTFDVNVHTVEGDQDSKVENALTLRYVE